MVWRIPGPDQVQTWSGPGPDQVRTRSRPGPDQVRTRSEPGPDQVWTWFGLGPDLESARPISKPNLDHQTILIPVKNMDSISAARGLRVESMFLTGINMVWRSRFGLAIGLADWAGGMESIQLPNQIWIPRPNPPDQLPNQIWIPRPTPPDQFSNQIWITKPY